MSGFSAGYPGIADIQIKARFASIARMTHPSGPKAVAIVNFGKKRSTAQAMISSGDSVSKRCLAAWSSAAKSSVHVSLPVPALIVFWSLCNFLSIAVVTGYDSDPRSRLVEITMPIIMVNKPPILHLSGGDVLILQFVMILTIGKRASVSTNCGAQRIAKGGIKNLICAREAQQCVNRLMPTHVLSLS